MEVKLSVYIVNHNYGKYIQKAIESVLSQTYQNYELLVIDNGSSDNSKKIIDSFLTNPKVRAIYQKNIGLNKTNNLALARTDGKYIIRLDADDFFHQNALEIMVNVLENNQNIGLVFSDYYLIDKNGEELSIFKRHDFEKVTLLDQPAHGACTLIRRKYLEILNGYDEDFNCQDGWDLWLKMTKKFGVKNINLPLFYYRQHGENLTNNEDRLLKTRSQIMDKVNYKKDPIINFNTIAVIPIRGDLVETNALALRKLGNKTVLDWTIEATLNAKNITNILVTSTDNNIKEHLKSKYGNKVHFFNRSWKLALINDSLDETLTSLFSKIPTKLRDFEKICLLSIEYPFKKSYSIDMAIDALDIFNTNVVYGVRQTDDLFFKHHGKGLKPLNKSNYIKKEENNIFKSCGGIFVFKRGFYFKDLMQMEKLGHIEIDEIGAFRISSNKSWEIAKTISKNKDLI